MVNIDVTSGTSPKPVRSGYLATLDGWRAIAILMVLVDHLIGQFLAEKNAVLFPGDYLIRQGGLGVFIFFGISGLLITSRLLEEKSALGSISLKGFYLRRALRILPAMLFFLIPLGLLGVTGIIKLPWFDWVRSLLFVRNYGPTGDWYTAHLWSLSIEEHFYLFWPMLLVLLGHRRGLWVALLASAVCTVWRVANIHWPFMPVWVGAAPWRTDLQIDALLFGAAIAIVRSEWGDAFLSRWLSPAITVICIAALPAMVICDRNVPGLLHITRALRPVVICLLLMGTVLHPQMGISRVLELSPLKWIGRLSYSLYLWQQLFTGPQTFEPNGHWMNVAKVFPINMVLLVAVVVVSYYAIEKPLIRLGHRLAQPVTPGRNDVPR